MTTNQAKPRGPWTSGGVGTGDGGPARKDFLVFGSPFIGEEEIQEVVETLRSGWIGTGPKTQRFEAEFAKYIGCKHAISLNSCTAGLELALVVAGVGEGDEVITTPMTFAATVNVIVHRRARPVLVDIEPDTFNMDPAKIKERITPRTKALIPVHFAGHPCDMDPIESLTRAYGLTIIEDAAHATEAWYQRRKVGNSAHMTAFSFYVTKNLTTGEGGMVTTNRDDYAERLRVLRLHGLSRDAWKRYSASGFVPYDVTEAGYKFNMTDVQAAMGIHQLARLEANLTIRQRHVQRYNEAFAEFSELITPKERGQIRHACHLYCILLRLERLTIDRLAFINALRQENIGCGINFVAIHLHSFYRERFGFARGDYPVAEFVSDRTVSLPLSAKMTETDVEDVIRAVAKVIRKYAR